MILNACEKLATLLNPPFYFFFCIHSKKDGSWSIEFWNSIGFDVKPGFDTLVVARCVMKNLLVLLLKIFKLFLYWMDPSLIPRPRGEKRVAWYPLFAHIRPFPEKPGNPHMFGNCSYNRYIYVRFIFVSSMMAASLLILLACRMVFRQIDAQKVSVS